MSVGRRAITMFPGVYLDSRLRSDEKRYDWEDQQKESMECTAMFNTT